MDRLKGITTLDEIDDELVDNAGVRKFVNVPPHSFLEDTCFENWDFDWSNSRDVLIKACGREAHLHFYLEKYFIVGPKTANVPVLHKPGWICK